MLTVTEVKNAKKRSRVYRIADGRGLCLEVRPNGSKLWRYRFRLNGKASMYAMGSYPETSLKDARNELAAVRKLVAQGLNPAHQRQSLKAENVQAGSNTFKMLAEEWIERNRGHWCERHQRNISRIMKNDIYPKIGQLPVGSIKPAQILEILEKVNGRGSPYIAVRIRQYCSGVFRHAIVTLRADSDPAAVLKGAIKSPRVRHHAPLSRDDIPSFLEAVDNYGGDETTKICLKLLLYLFVRPVELRQADWAEFDIEAALWRIPAARMKMREEHIVPLSMQAISLLSKLQTITGTRRYLFPNQHRPTSWMGETTTNRALARMGYRGRFTSHGFRATASTALNEMGYRPDVIERQLAHKERNSSRDAYNRSQYLDERREMLQQWADYLDSLVSGESVVPIRTQG